MIKSGVFCLLGYRLVILYSKEEEAESHFISKLQLYRRPFMPETSAEVYQKYLADHFSSCSDDSLSAAMVDHEKYHLHLYLVYIAGLIFLS